MPVVESGVGLMVLPKVGRDARLNGFDFAHRIKGKRAGAEKETTVSVVATK